MFNLDISNEVEQQSIIYKLLELKIYNNEFICSDESPLGYTKVYNDFNTVERLDFNNCLVVNNLKPYYTLEWNLFLDYSKYELLVNIVNSHKEDIKTDLRDSMSIFSPVVTQNSSIILKDNKIKDVVLNRYVEYKINITEMDFFSNIFFKDGKVIVSLKGETL